MLGYHCTVMPGAVSPIKLKPDKGKPVQRCEFDAEQRLFAGKVGRLVIAYLVPARVETSSFSMHPFAHLFLIPSY